MSACWHCDRCSDDHLGNCPVTGTADNSDALPSIGEVMALVYEHGNERAFMANHDGGADIDESRLRAAITALHEAATRGCPKCSGLRNNHLNKEGT